MLIEQKLKLEEELKETKVLLDKLYNLIFIQSREIDVIQIRLAILQKNYSKAEDILDISKNIPKEAKELLKNEIEEEKEKQGNSELLQVT